jgi:Secretion system C-terminal sorting domain
MKQIYIASLLTFLGNFNSFFTHGQTWSTPAIAHQLSYSTGAESLFSSMVEITANPAVAYYDNQHGNLMYIKANDAAGSSWNTPIIIESTLDVGQKCEMRIVSGNPAIVYAVGNDIHYVRANDAQGNSWGAPIFLETGWQYGSPFTFAVINGKPAFGYKKSNNIYYKQANDIVGSSWPTTSKLISSGTRNSGLEFINGRPAILFVSGNYDINYIRANDADGVNWPSSPILAAGTGGDNSLGGGNAFLKLVNGKPAISYLNTNGSPYSLNYIQADDIDGLSWMNTPIQLAYSSSSLMDGGDLGVVNGNPVVFYKVGYSTGDFYFKRATQMDGNTWGTSNNLGNPRYNNSFGFAVIDGKPAVCGATGAGLYFNFNRASTADGSGTWMDVAMPVLTISAGTKPSGSIIGGTPMYVTRFGSYSNSKLKFTYANNAAGTNWQAIPIEVSANCDNNSFPKLMVANTHPAVIWGGFVPLRFKRAQNASGTGWASTEINLTTSGNVFDFAGITTAGNPSVAFIQSGVRFIRANDASGNTWPSPQLVDNTSNHAIDLSIVNGNPAIAFGAYQSGVFNLKFVRATDASGSNWATPVNITSENPEKLILRIVNGNPAVIYQISSGNGVKYIRANDANGTSWPASAQTLVSTSVSTSDLSFEIISGKPAVTYTNNSNYNLSALFANDINGTSWGASGTIYDAVNGLLPNTLFSIAPDKACLVFFNPDENFTMFTTTQVAAPLELTKFQANQTKSENHLQWQTATETQTHHFDLERSKNGNQDFEKIAEIRAAGESKELKNYEFFDREPFLESYYRLKMVDNDGQFEYSKIVFVKRNDRQSLQLFPNPVLEKEFDIQFDAPEGDLSVVILDALGRLIFEEKIESAGGFQTQKIKLDNLSAGSYRLELRGEATREMITFLKN